jgi:ketosteroid isomerase-like protein
MLDTDFGQFAPTNKRINVNIVNMIKMQNGKISEIRVFYDSALIMKQLGVSQARQRAA